MHSEPPCDVPDLHTGDMATRVARLRPCLDALEESLQDFIKSKSTFRRLFSIGFEESRQSSPSTAKSNRPSKLYILDSSYNPPSKAHATLAVTALKNADTSRPPRLLLLFST